MSTVSQSFIAIGSNRHSYAGDWSPPGSRDLVAYAAGSSIALWDPSSSTGGVINTITGFQGPVYAVRFISLPQYYTPPSHIEYLIIGSSGDSSAKIWAIDKDYNHTLLATLQGHSGSVTCLASLTLGSTLLLALGSADRYSTLWTIDFKTLFNSTSSPLLLDTPTQSLQIGSRFHPLTLALSILPTTQQDVILAIGGTNSSIYTYISSLKDIHDGLPNGFSQAAVLTGHEDWIRGLDFTLEEPNGDLLLASCSQDCYIRIWRLHSGEALPERRAGQDNTNDPVMASMLSNKAYHLQCLWTENYYSITFEALLIGHDDWIYTVRWHPNSLQLMSCSDDSSLMIWAPDEDSGIWISISRLGHLSIKGSSTATGSAGGFVDCLWNRTTGDQVCTTGRTGCWRLWKYNTKNDNWDPQLAITGHTKSVSDICWAKSGNYLLSCSLDQTTRLWAQWTKNSSGWHEFSRPQIHGYDMICLGSIRDSLFVSGGEEKILRVFEEPRAVANLLYQLCDIPVPSNVSEAATVPALSLSNKAVRGGEGEGEEEEEEGNDDDQDEAAINSVGDLKTPPLEDQLMRHTLWPEIDKLYGHGYEIACVAVSHSGKVIATSCRANTLTHGAVRLFETESWESVGIPLESHNLTITRLQFSLDDNYLLSVGRDRLWTLYEQDTSNELVYKFHMAMPKAHTRIIWDCAWINNTSFATVGRDKSIKLWAFKDNEWINVASAKSAQPLTAVDICDGKIIVGDDTGRIFIYHLTLEDFSLQLVDTLPLELCPAARINRISFHPKDTSQIAVASDDHSVRIYKM